MGAKLRPKEAAEYIGMGETKIRTMLSEGLLPFLKLGEKHNSPVLIDTDDLDRLMAAWSKPATSGPLATERRAG